MIYLRGIYLSWCKNQFCPSTRLLRLWARILYCSLCLQGYFSNQPRRKACRATSANLSTSGWRPKSPTDVSTPVLRPHDTTHQVKNKSSFINKATQPSWQSRRHYHRSFKKLNFIFGLEDILKPNVRHSRLCRFPDFADGVEEAGRYVEFLEDAAKTGLYYMP
jgi:hypothetical protein